MDRRERVQTPGLAVEVAKLRLRVAAEKAEPARLLRQQVARSPAPTLVGALLAGLALGRRGHTGAATTERGPAAGLARDLLALVLRAASEWKR